jgi:hypothetical protein
MLCPRLQVKEKISSGVFAKDLQHCRNRTRAVTVSVLHRKSTAAELRLAGVS